MNRMEQNDEASRQVIQDVVELQSMREYWRCRVQIGASIKQIGFHTTADL